MHQARPSTDSGTASTQGQHNILLSAACRWAQLQAAAPAAAAAVLCSRTQLKAVAAAVISETQLQAVAVALSMRPQLQRQPLGALR